MRGSNPRPLAHKTNTLPTELTEPVCLTLSPSQAAIDRMRVRGLVVMIVACQVMDPGSIPGERSFFSRTLSYSLVHTHTLVHTLVHHSSPLVDSISPTLAHSRTLALSHSRAL